jgi:hypothetical protein
METDTLLAPIRDCEHREVGRVVVDTFRAGNARVKRMIYPQGFNWRADLQETIGSTLCEHAHVGFLAQGEMHVRFENGDIEIFKAPQFVAVQPGHEGWVVGDKPAVLVEFDFEGATVATLDLPVTHLPK